jgi:hypothetical protein
VEIPVTVILAILIPKCYTIQIYMGLACCMQHSGRRTGLVAGICILLQQPKLLTDCYRTLTMSRVRLYRLCQLITQPPFELAKFVLHRIFYIYKFE